MAVVVIPTLISFISGAPFVPTPMQSIRKILEKIKIPRKSRVYEIGCGDGRFVHEAAKKYGAQCTGFELSLPVYLLAILRKFITQSPAKIIWGDFRMYSLHDADIVFCYLMPESLKNFIPKFENELKPGALIISYAFHIGDWKPHQHIPWNKQERISDIWVYKMGEQ